MFKERADPCSGSAFLSPTASVVSQEAKKISLVYPSLAFTQSHIWVAKEEWLFKSTDSTWTRFFYAVGSGNAGPGRNGVLSERKKEWHFATCS